MKAQMNADQPGCRFADGERFESGLGMAVFK